MGAFCAAGGGWVKWLNLREKEFFWFLSPGFGKSVEMSLDAANMSVCATGSAFAKNLFSHRISHLAPNCRAARTPHAAA
jgi:hypothetical protein